MSLTVTIVDDQTGERETAKVADGDYLLITVAPCWRHSVQTHANGTHVITVKDHRPGHADPAVPDYRVPMREMTDNEAAAEEATWD